MTENSNNSTWLLYSDGASLGNPGPSGAGAILYDPEGQTRAEVSLPLGLATNNEAEYLGFVHGLKIAIEHKVKTLMVKMDSQLVARQINGIYKVKNERLRVFYQEAMELIDNFDSCQVVHVRRELNAAADALASKAAKRNQKIDK